MRKTAVLIALAATLGGCGMFKHGIQTTPSYREPNSTAIYGSWVLKSPDSTSFIGANSVQLELQPGTFDLTATYPGRTPVHVQGSAHMTETGILLLTPTSSLSDPIQGRSLNFVANQPISLIASAAGSTLVFAPASRSDPTPSSVWYKAETAAKAGVTNSSNGSVPPQR